MYNSASTAVGLPILFGRNKTWRGLVVLPILTAIGVLLFAPLDHVMRSDFSYRNYSQIGLGFLLGLAYVLFELPNSWIKRKLQIPEGQRPQKYKWFFTLLDQGDSALGAVFVYLGFSDISLELAVQFVLYAIGIHMFFNGFLYLIGLRKEPL